tara:strand:- start:102 stop:806 length:705 start_codon:yes stop_codon:yes gene_type:complete
MNVFCFIFARGGSKSIKNKNIIKFNNKPLIANTILQAKRIKLINKVFVSTDSKRIAKIAKKYGAIIPFLRPKKLATDVSPEYLSWKHAIKNCEKLFKEKIDIFVSLPTTSPLRKDEDINKSLNFFIKNRSKYDMLVSTTKTNHLPGFNIVKVLKNGTFKLEGGRNKKLSRRQQVKNIQNLSTCFYYANKDYVNKCKQNPLFTGKKYAYLIDKKNAIDIDDKLDLDLAKYLFKKK